MHEGAESDTLQMDAHLYYSCGQLPQTGPFTYKGKLTYHVPRKLLPTSTDIAEYFTRQYFLKVTATMQMRKDISVVVPIVIVEVPPQM